MAHTRNLILRIVAQAGEIGSGELVEVAHRFGLSADAVRAATNRLVQSAYLSKVETGRGRTRFRIGPEGQLLIEQWIAKVLRWHMAPEGQLDWDGSWLVVTFGIPESQRAKRDTLRLRLEEMGFGLLTSGVWISPFHGRDEVTKLVHELDLSRQVAILDCRELSVPGLADARELAARVWPLADLRLRYEEVNRRLEALTTLLEGAGRGQEVDVQAAAFEALDIQSELVDIFAEEDPCLPVDLLPLDWPGHRTHDLFHHLAGFVDRLDLVGDRHGYLLHLIQGMEVLNPYRSGQDGFHWPEERAEAR